MKGIFQIKENKYAKHLAEESIDINFEVFISVAHTPVNIRAIVEFLHSI